MRLVRQIPHEHFMISLHEYNGKYKLSIVLDDYEQHFKVPVNQISNLNELEKKLTPAFYTACLHDFIQMRERWLNLLNHVEND